MGECTSLTFHAPESCIFEYRFLSHHIRHNAAVNPGIAECCKAQFRTAQIAIHDFGTVEDGIVQILSV